VLLAALAVAVATPAYPALAAAMPRLAGRESESATHLLVTVEVGSFVVGPALGGLLLVAPSVVGPTAAVATGAALGLLVGVSLPGPVRATGSAPARMGAVLRGSSVLRRCLLVMAGLNLAASATTVALLPMATGGWTAGWADDAAYGVASASLGFGALAAPALMRLGPSPAARVRIGLVVTGAALLVVAWSPSVAWALAPLLVAGAASVHAESAATAVIQAEAPDEVRASLFGLADAVMVAAAMLGSLVAPAVSGWVGPPALLAALGLGVAAGAVGVRAARPDPAVEPLLEESAVS
jgi:hypothetical protein